MGLAPSEAAWNLERELVQHLEKIWDLPDEGLWEVRGGRRQFTHSKVMAWVALDRADRSVEDFGLPGPLASTLVVEFSGRSAVSGCGVVEVAIGPGRAKVELQ